MVARARIAADRKLGVTSAKEPYVRAVARIDAFVVLSFFLFFLLLQSGFFFSSFSILFICSLFSFLSSVSVLFFSFVLSRHSHAFFPLSCRERRPELLHFHFHNALGGYVRAYSPSLLLFWLW